MNHLKECLNQGSTDAHVLQWLQPAAPAPKESFAEWDYQQDPGAVGSTPPAQETLTVQTWVQWDHEWYYSLDPSNGWYYWQKWPAEQTPWHTAKASEGWASNAETWQHPEPQRWPTPQEGRAPRKVTTKDHEALGAAKSKVTSVRAQDWGSDPTRWGKVKECLKAGSPAPGNLVAVSTSQELDEIQDLRRAFEDPHALTVLAVGEAAALETMYKTQLSITRDKIGAKIENVGLLQICASKKGPWTRPARKVSQTSIPVSPKMTVRIVAPGSYRSAFLKGPGMQDSPSLVIQSLAQSAGVQISDLLGGSWQSHVRGSDTHVVGFLKLRQAVVQKVLSCSGDKGVFLSLTGQSNRVEPFWIRTTTGESREDHFLRVAAMKRVRNQPLLFRPGEGGMI